MTGLSGGGWTSTVYPAIDTRIRGSYPVAGSIPIPWRQDYRDLGDSEQNDPGFYALANYSELYLMASYGTSRSQTQILNYNDTCCFGGWSLPHGWVSSVQAALSDLGEGHYYYYMDYTHVGHKISEYGLSIIFKPVPSIGAIEPQSAVAHGPGVTLTVGGGDFYQDSVVQWNGGVRPTHYMSNTELQVEIAATDLEAVGTFTVTVFNPSPGGGTSNPEYFEVISSGAVSSTFFPIVASSED